MSLVGPRPLPVEESLQCAPWQRQRLAVVPGLTCVWQVRGRSTVSFEEWMRMDLEYLRSRSLSLRRAICCCRPFPRSCCSEGRARQVANADVVARNQVTVIRTQLVRLLTVDDRQITADDRMVQQASRSRLRMASIWATARVAAGLQNLCGNRCRDGFGILMYHRVAERVPGVEPPTSNVTPERFRRQLSWFA